MTKEGKSRWGRGGFVHIAAALFVVGLTGLSGACSDPPDDGPSTDPSNAENMTTKEVGSAGGTLELSGVTLEVPAGAVESDVEITVEQTDASAPDDLTAYSPVYRFRPEGLSFAKPVEVRLPVEGAAEVDEVVLFWTMPEAERSDGAPEYRSRASNRVDGEVVATVDHFSGGFAGQPRSCMGGECPGPARCVAGSCLNPDCDDRRMNGLETDTDCGGPHCGGCQEGKRCEVASDCRSERCVSGRCLIDGPVDAGMDAAVDTAGMDADRDTSPMDAGDSGDAADAQVDAADSGVDANDVDTGSAGPIQCYGSGGTSAPECPWIRLVGGAAKERALGVAVGLNGEVYVAGRTTDGFDGKSYQGGIADGFVKRYDAQGSAQWTRILGSSEFDSVEAIAVGGQGRVTLAGSTLSAFYGASDPHQPDRDAFAVQFSQSGTVEWTRIFGTSDPDYVAAAAADTSGNSYVGGKVTQSLHGHDAQGRADGFVVKYDSTGSRQWTRLIATSEGDQVRGLATDGSGNVYAVGTTSGSLHGETAIGGGDAFIVKYDATGQRLWTRLMGTVGHEIAEDVATDASGNAYLVSSVDEPFAGQTYNGGRSDGLGAKFSASGQRQWVRLFGIGSTRTDEGYAVATDTRGFVYFVGFTDAGSGGNHDGFVAKYSLQGSPEGMLRFGAAGEEFAHGAAGASSGIYVSGWTDQSLGGQTYLGGDIDSFVGRIDW